jgi:murein DD-endopeptidase MepM/ murein hydrolase activator NlpD
MRVAAAGILLVIAVAGTVKAGILESLEVSATSQESREVRPGAKRLKAPVDVSCSAECSAVARGNVIVDRANKPSLNLSLKPARSDLPADQIATLRPRLSRTGTKRLQNSLDRSGTSAVVEFNVRASDESDASAEDSTETRLEPGLAVLSRKVSPDTAFFDAKREPKIRFRFRAPGRTGMRVELRRGRDGALVRAWNLDAARPFVRRRVRWDGITRKGAVGKDGRYSFHLGESGGKLDRAGGFSYHGHVFPVAGPHGTRGSIGEFGAPRNGGRAHEGFDITGDCGTRLVAARGGKVVRRSFDGRLYGWFVDIRARKSGRRFFYSHLRGPPPVKKGDRVKTGQTVGEIGQTGNAASTPCHLHFEVRAGGRPINPKPELEKWDRWS